MKKYLLISAIMTVISLSAFSQPTEGQLMDSLKKRSHKLQGADKVDCLNSLAEKLSRSKIKKWSDKADSVNKYAAIALEEARKIDYKKGIAYSLTLLADGEYLRGIELRISKKDDSVPNEGMKKYLSQAIPIAVKAGDNETLGYAYQLWGDMLYLKSKFADNDSKAVYQKKSIEHFALAGNKKMEGEICIWLSESYYQRGYYEEAFDYCNRALKLIEKVLSLAKTKEEKAFIDFLYWQSLTDMGSLYKTAGDYSTSLEYINKAEQFAFANDSSLYDPSAKAEIFYLGGNHDSLFNYLNIAIKKDADNPFWKFGLGAAYLQINNYDSALIFTQQAMPALRKRNVNGKILIQPLLNIGFAYSGIKQYAKAMRYARDGMGLAKKLGDRPEIMRGYQLLSEIHHGLKNHDSAYVYILKYYTIKDSIQNKQFLLRLYNYKKAAEDEKKQSHIGLLKKDNKIKAQQLKQEGLIKKMLIAGLILFSLIGIFIFRTLTLKRKNEKLRRVQVENDMKVQQLENEKQHSDLQRKASELEMQALRAQMNPHFIFNCLSSINRFILKNEIEIASDYLTRFSRLIRMVLIYSQKSLISLEDELEILKLYLDMERLRFKDAFDYNIIFTNRIDAGAVYIPPLLLQPFCENAIWHGIMHKEEKGHLNIALNMENRVLHCCISDDGIGREKASQFKSKSAEKDKSLGLKITTERLALLNGENAISTFYEINDILDEDENVVGTKVDLRIKYRESMEEYI
jgi:tetratricopeptide (TPR) repeat protein